MDVPDASYWGQLWRLSDQVTRVVDAHLPWVPLSRGIECVAPSPSRMRYRQVHVVPRR